MALIQRMASDITGVEGEEHEFAQLIIRDHPDLDSARALDVLPSEIEGLTEAKDIVLVEVKRNGVTRQFAVKLADFKKVVSDEIVESARSNRGRRPGFSPNAIR